MTYSMLGTDKESGQRVEIHKTARLSGLYILGSTGTGKTGLIENLIMQDIDQGTGVGLIDPHGDLVNAVLGRLPDDREQDVILLDIHHTEAPFGLNLYECSNPSDMIVVQRTVSQIMHIFEKVYQISRSTPQMHQYMRNAAWTLLTSPGYTMTDIPLLLTNTSARAKMTAGVTDIQNKIFWTMFEQKNKLDRDREVAATVNKLDEFLQPLLRNIVGQARTTINFLDILDRRKILLVKLDSSLGDVTSLIGAVLIAQMLSASYQRPQHKRKQFNLYLDEVQRFSTEDMATILSESRKYGLALTLAHQYRDQLDHLTKGATMDVANFVIFRISGTDAEEIAKSFDRTPPPPEIVEEEVLGAEKEVEIQTPVQDVFYHVLRHGSNPHPVVNTFAQGTLRKMEQKAREYEPSHEAFTYLNGIFYKAMTGTYPRVAPEPIQSLAGHLGFSYYHLFDKNDHTHYLYTALEECLNNDFSSFASLNIATWNYVRDCELHEIEWRRNDLEDTINAVDYLKHLRQYISPEEFVKKHSGYAPEAFAERYRGFAHSRSWIHIDPSSLQWKEIPAASWYDSKWQFTPGQEKNWYTERDLRAYVDDFVKKQKEALRAFVTEIHAVMRALAADPLKTGSGIYEIKQDVRIQKRTLPQKTTAEMEHRVADRLTKLPNHAAQVRIDGHEYIIETIKPKEGLWERKLQERIERIHAYNIAQGITRPKDDVEKEIFGRQLRLLEQSAQQTAEPSPAAPPPSPNTASSPSVTPTRRKIT